MGAILDIQYRAEECRMLQRHESAWNSRVHDPLFSLAFEDGRNNHRARGAEEKAAEDIRLSNVHLARVENVTSATVTENCVPRWKRTATQLIKKDSEGAVSVLAWSLSETSASSISNSLVSGGLDQE